MGIWGHNLSQTMPLPVPSSTSTPSFTWKSDMETTEKAAPQDNQANFIPFSPGSPAHTACPNMPPSDISICAQCAVKFTGAAAHMPSQRLCWPRLRPLWLHALVSLCYWPVQGQPKSPGTCADRPRVPLSLIGFRSSLLKPRSTWIYILKMLSSTGNKGHSHGVPVHESWQSKKSEHPFLFITLMNVAT